jgi:hypothetical protein
MSNVPWDLYRITATILCILGGCAILVAIFFGRRSRRNRRSRPNGLHLMNRTPSDEKEPSKKSWEIE